MALETPDNQLDFNKLYLYNFNDDNFSYKWNQYREIVPRKTVPNDPIVKSRYVFSKGFMFCVSLRSSGKFDLYWNMTRKESPEDSMVISRH